MGRKRNVYFYKLIMIADQTEKLQDFHLTLIWNWDKNVHFLSRALCNLIKTISRSFGNMFKYIKKQDVI